MKRKVMKERDFITLQDVLDAQNIMIIPGENGH